MLDILSAGLYILCMISYRKGRCMDYPSYSKSAYWFSFRGESLSFYDRKQQGLEKWSFTQVATPKVPFSIPDYMYKALNNFSVKWKR